MQQHDATWLEHFRSEGYPRAEPLGAGMEGAVYRLEDGLVAKVWGDKSLRELDVLRRFYDELADASLPFATPRIHRTAARGDATITYEAELLGRPLQDQLDESAAVAPAAAVACVIDVLQGLAATGPSPAAFDLVVLDEENRFRGEDGWKESLLALLERRISAFGEQLRAAVPEFDRVHQKVEAAVAGVPAAAHDAIIHGDVCGVNILVDAKTAPTAVLDWGFLTTVGDPMFDAAVAAGIFNMYGPHAPAIDQQVAAALETSLGYPAFGMLVYRAAYAIATSNAYDPEGRDGHFAWCAATLRRPDVLRALDEAGD